MLAATQGTPLDYPDPPSDLKALGLNLKERSSGKHQGPLNITKRGPAKARRSLYFTALRWSYKEAVIGAWYRNKVKRDGNRKGKAIIAIMRKRALGNRLIPSDLLKSSVRVFRRDDLRCPLWS